MTEVQKTLPGKPAVQEEKRAARETEQPINMQAYMGFLFLHALLGIAFRFIPFFATVHAMMTLAAGVVFLLVDSKPTRVICTMAYITGAEVLWRATGASVFWETGKYALIGLCLGAFLKYSRGKKISVWPLLYFGLLVPSVLALPSFDRSAIAFNLAGPFALAAAVLFFSMVRIDLDRLKVILIFLLAPVVAIGVRILGSIAASQNIVFGNISNYVTSGDYGPNQVSMLLALGGLAAVYLVFLEKKTVYRLFFLGLSLWLLAQSALTFSRGGMWTTAAAVFATGVFFFRSGKLRTRFILAAIIFGLLANYVIFPYLNRFTGNAITTRFENLNSTGRFEIVQADLMVFNMFPVLGVGPGQSAPYHALTFRDSSAHTEYTRMLAEHGIFGLLSLLILAWVSFRRLTAKGEPLSKGFIIGLTVWALVYMASAATRTVEPAFLFGLAAAKFALSEKPT